MTRTTALFIFLAGLNGLIAVLASIWAAHGFFIPLVAGGDVLADTGSRFQMWHALAFLGIGLTLDRAPAARALLVLAGLAFLIGIAGFSGGLYASAGGSPISGLAPIGGYALIAGWVLLTLAGGVALVLPRTGLR
jgi:uncharacterized membrane protein YgdD (TMEM256/DUF423 family)